MGMKRFFLLFLALIIFIQPCFAIKIGLQTNTGRTYIGSSTDAEIIDCNTNKLVFIMEKMKGYEFKPYRKVIAIKVDGQFKKINSDKNKFFTNMFIPKHPDIAAIVIINSVLM